MQYSLKELEAMDTIEQSQFDDLKHQGIFERVWLSRMSIEDGQPYNNQVTIERSKIYFSRGKRKSTRWEITEQYEAI